MARSPTRACFRQDRLSQGEFAATDLPPYRERSNGVPIISPRPANPWSVNRRAPVDHWYGRKFPPDGE